MPKWIKRLFYFHGSRSSYWYQSNSPWAHAIPRGRQATLKRGRSAIPKGTQGRPGARCTRDLVVPGYPHHVTQRGNGRARTFFGDGDYKLYRVTVTVHLIS